MSLTEPLFQPYEVAYAKKNGRPPIKGMSKVYFPTVRIKYRTKSKTLLEPDTFTDRWAVWKY